MCWPIYIYIYDWVYPPVTTLYHPITWVSLCRYKASHPSGYDPNISSEHVNGFVSLSLSVVLALAGFLLVFWIFILVPDSLKPNLSALLGIMVLVATALKVSYLF